MTEAELLAHEDYQYKQMVDAIAVKNDSDIYIYPSLIPLGENIVWSETIMGHSDRTLDLGGQHSPNAVAIKQLAGRTSHNRARIKKNELALLKIGGVKNFWINGAMHIWQYGTSGTQGAGNTYISDCLLCRGSNDSGGTTNWARDIYLNEECIKFNNVDCVNGSSFSTRLEEDRLRALMGKTVTVSFYYALQNDVECRIGYGVFSDDGYDVGADTHIEIGTLVGDGTWRRAKATFEVHDGANLLTEDGYLQFTIHYESASGGLVNGDYRFTKCQIELSNKATDFEHMNKGTSLELCKRYYEVVNIVELQGITYTPNGDTRASLYELVPKHVPPLIEPSSLGLFVIGQGSSAFANKAVTVDLGVNKDTLYVVDMTDTSNLADYGTVVSWGDNQKRTVILNSEVR